MSAFDKMMGRPQQPVNEALPGIPQSKVDPQEAMAMKMLKMMMPGFDPNIINKIGKDAQEALEYFRVSMEEVKRQNADIIARLERIEANAPAKHGGISPFGGQ